MKARLKGAQTGRNLLKKKADALSMRFRQILRKIIEVPCIFKCILQYCNTTKQLENVLLMASHLDVDRMDSA